MPHLQQQLVDVELDSTCVDALLHDVGAKVICTVEGHQGAAADLLVD